MSLFGRPRLALDERRAVDAALDEAFAPLRATTANISAARVRAAVRWSRPEPARLRGIPLLARFGELSMAAVISALVFSGTLASLSVVPQMPDLSRDPAHAGEWVLNGRAAYQPPMESRATDYRTTAGDTAANAVTIRRQATTAQLTPEQTPPNQ